MDWIRDNFRLLLMVAVAAALTGLVISKHMPKSAPAPHEVQAKSPLAGKTPKSWTGPTKILGAAALDCRKLHLDTLHCRQLPRKLRAKLADASGQVIGEARIDRNSQFTMHVKLQTGDYTVSVSGARLKGQTPLHVAVVPQTLPALVVVGR